MLDGVRLLLFVICLLPGFIRFAWYYFVTANRRVVRYGQESCRQTVDVYSARSQSTGLLRSPVLVFIPGGAWVIGYKMWGALLARVLSHPSVGITVVIADYRSYPFAPIQTMVSDVEKALLWTLDNVEENGGDPKNVVIAGQSAGGHLACTALLRAALGSVATGDGDSSFPASRLDPMDFKGVISLSAPFDLEAIQKSFLRHGMDKHLIDRVFGYERDRYDAIQLARALGESGGEMECQLPPFRIYHGDKDKTVPHEGSEHFAQALQDAGMDASYETYVGWSHTDAILEGPMVGDHRFHADIVHAVNDWTDGSNLSWPDEDSMLLGKLCPSFLVRAGKFFMPF